LNSKTLLTLQRIWVFLVCFLVSSCEETLPPREEPRNFLVATIGLNPGPVVIQDSTGSAREGSFVLELKNLFDEVLQDSALVQGTIEIWLKKDPSQRRLITCTEGDLSNNVVRFGLATLGVDSSAKLTKAWNHKTNEGVPFWSFGSLSPRISHGGVPYCESDSLQFVARATIQLFRNVQPVPTQQIEFSLTYWVFGIVCN